MVENPGLFHIGEKILKNLDVESQVICRLVKRSWNHLFERKVLNPKKIFDVLLRTMKIPKNVIWSKEIFDNSNNRVKWMSFIKKIEGKAHFYLWFSHDLQRMLKDQIDNGISTSP